MYGFDIEFWFHEALAFIAYGIGAGYVAARMFTTHQYPDKLMHFAGLTIIVLAVMDQLTSLVELLEWLEGLQP